ncbi:MAG: sce7726 family protein [Acholeplasmataceae bacterium]|jgi:hypothetical protein|nr:sce7726 family protein [Acholeplasmataceae bacterium]
MNSVEQLKKLFYTYSPLKSNNELKFDYIDITYNYPNPNKNIRSIYNELISSGFFNETVIKSRFVEVFSFNKSPTNTITIFELNSSNSRADICMVNGHSEVFEIKTIYDTFYRLEDQLNDYLLLYDYVNIIIPKERNDVSLVNIPKNIGILTYYKNRLGNISFKRVRKPLINNNINPKTQLEQITKKELLKLFKLNTLDSTSKEEIINEILFNYTAQKINTLFKTYIKDKYQEQWLFLHKNRDNFYMLDYQWFFKNNISYELVYR